MVALILFLWYLVATPFKSRSRVEAENVSLRQQLAVLPRRVHGRVPLTDSDRLFFVWLYRLFPSVLKTVTIVRPETVVRWHRAGFRAYWRWKFRSLGGRPRITAGLRGHCQTGPAGACLHQISMRKVDGWQTLATKPIDQPIDLAA